MRVRPKFNRTDSLIETWKQRHNGECRVTMKAEMSDMSTSKRMSRTVGNQQNQEETRGSLALLDSLILDL